MKKIAIMMISAFCLCLASCGNQSKENSATGEDSMRADSIQAAAANAAAMEAAKEAARLDSLREDSIRQQAFKIKQAMPTPLMFGSRISEESGSLKDVKSVRSELTSLGYTKINNNKFVLESEGSPLVTVGLNYKVWRGEFDPETGEEIGASTEYTITITYANKADADSFYKAWTKACKAMFVTANKSGSTVTLFTYGD